MKVRTNKKVKIDWTILATTETPEDRNNPEYILDYVTSGFSKHNFGGEVMVVGKVKNSETIANLINTFCRMMIKGEKFLPGYTHTISGADGKVQFRFNVCEYTPANGNVKYQLIPAL